MTAENLQLIPPSLDLARQYEAFCREFPDPHDIHGQGGMIGPDDIPAGVPRCRDQSRGENLSAGFVPASTFWLVGEGGRILGTINIRHRLNDFLLREGGHIGYAVRSSEQNKGYATRMLAMTLEWVREQLGLSRVLITCDRENPASARVIVKCGGVLENEVPSSFEGRAITQRYWIAL